MARYDTTRRDDHSDAQHYVLTIPREEARRLLTECRDRGRQLHTDLTDVRTWEQLEVADAEHCIWADRCVELLTRLVDSSELRDRFGYGDRGCRDYADGTRSINEVFHDLRKRLGAQVRMLTSLLYRLDLIPEVAVGMSGRTTRTREGSDEPQIFIIHGHDVAAKESVARFLEQQGIRAIILHEQPNQGRTIIEKLEACASDYAIVLLTPDDVGGHASQRDRLMPRARQNVIFELGLFIGLLGRGRVCALLLGDIEWPSDIHGVAYHPFGAGWKLDLAKELTVAGFEIDLRRAT